MRFPPTLSVLTSLHEHNSRHRRSPGALSRCLDTDSARRVVDFRIAPSVQQRIDILAERTNEGTLSGSERSEYEALINTAEIISILKLKARQFLESPLQ
jgi:hypothetical protein